MAYILGLVVLALFFLALHYFTETTKPQKMLITMIASVVILGAIAFNSYSTYEREMMMQTVMKFHQNKVVVCNGVEVNNSEFTLSIGTYTFIGKETGANYGQMISVSDCE